MFRCFFKVFFLNFSNKSLTSLANESLLFYFLLLFQLFTFAFSCFFASPWLKIKSLSTGSRVVSCQFPPHIRDRKIDGVVLWGAGNKGDNLKFVVYLVKLRSWFLLLDAACDLIKWRLRITWKMICGWKLVKRENKNKDF